MRLATTLILALPLSVALAQTRLQNQTQVNPAAIPGHPIVSDSTSLPFAGPTGAARQQTVTALQTTLTDLQQLGLQTRQAHWNVSGDLFYPLHELLEEHHAGLAMLSDRVAERLLAIGISADGRASTVVAHASIPEIPGGFLDDGEVIDHFANVYHQAGGIVRQHIQRIDNADPTSANLLQEVDAVLGEYQWQMRAHRQSTSRRRN